MVAKEDLDRFGQETDRRKKECTTRMQYLLNAMSMIPKKDKGGFRMIASMAKGERAWNSQAADENDAARPGSCCLHVMGDHHISIDILRALGFDTLQGL